MSKNVLHIEASSLRNRIYIFCYIPSLSKIEAAMEYEKK